MKEFHEARAKAEDELAKSGIITPGYRLRQLEAKLTNSGAPQSAQADLAERAAAKLKRDQPVSRAEAAAYLGVSTRSLGRPSWEKKLPRCPSFGSVVRYAARDVLRIASAMGKER